MQVGISIKYGRISILEDEKSPRALVQILSPGGARGIYFVLPTVKKMLDDVIEKSANQKRHPRIFPKKQFQSVADFPRFWHGKLV
jgi:hypothetical protein